MSSVQQDSFWTSEDKIPISQKSVSIPSSNGLEYKGGQRVVVEVPPTVEFIQPKESYLQFDVKLQLPTGATHETYLQLDETLGAQILLKDVRIYSGGAGKILLEEYQDYNVLTNVKYTYETNDVIRAKRALTEGSSCHTIATRTNRGTTESHKNDPAKNLYFDNVASNAAGTVFDNTNFKTVKVQLPINTGLFSSNKVLPTLLTEGLVLDIQLESGNRVYRQLDTARLNTKALSKPVFHGITAAGAPIVGGAGTGGGTSVAATEIFLAKDNTQMTKVEHCPFCVGERIGFAKVDTAAAELDDTVVDVEPTDTFVIDEIVIDATYVKLVMKGTGGKLLATADDVTSNNFIVFSTSVGADYSAFDYTVSNVELVLQQLEMPQGYKSKMMSMMKEGGSMNYDFLSFTNYKYSQLQSDRVANIRLPLNMSRAKAILSVPTDATVYIPYQAISGGLPSAAKTYITFEEATAVSTSDKFECSDKSGINGIVDYLTNYQFFYDGKLNPSRRVDTSKTSSQVSISQQPLIELEKALSMSNITPFSFREFNTNFVIGRALSLHNGCYNAVGKDFNLQLEYNESTAPTKNKLWCNFVSHLRRIEFRGDGISLQV